MGWNGSGMGGNSTPIKPKVKYPPSEASFAKQSGYRGAKKPSPVRGVIAGLFVVAAVCVAYFAFFTGSEKTGSEKMPQKAVEQKKPTAIKEVTPAAAPKAEAKLEPEKPKELPPQRVGEIRNGYRLLSSGRLHKVKGVIHVGGRGDSLVDRTFDHGSDRMIAHLLMAEPGGTMVGDSVDIMRGFNEAFAKSLKDEIIIKHDDTDEVKALKQAVIDARSELKQQMALGKSAEEAMIEARDQLHELTLYREDLEKEVLSHAEDGMSQKDYDDLIGAANLMLEERGIGKVQMPKLIGDAIEMRYRHKMAELERKQRELEKKMKEEEVK